MKKLPMSAALLMAIFFSNSLHAQLFKKLINSVTQSTQKKANNKVDSSVQTKLSSSSAGDTASTNRVLGAFAKAAADNPNDTSSADLTAKALSNLMGGGGVSKADSVAAIKSFTSAKGGNGFYYQMITTITNTSAKHKGTNSDTTTTIFTSGGEARSEMNIAALMGAKGSTALLTLQHLNQPHYSLTLDASDKTYSLNVIDTSFINSGVSNYKVTKIGNETVQGYNCTHAKLVSTIGSGAFRSSTTMDMWMSTEVPGYAFIQKAMTAQNITPKMMRALQQAGCDGYFVKIATQGKDYSMNMILVKAQQKNFPASMFTIPAGYKESNENMMYHMMGGKH
jgi:hypothetical protein